MEFWRQTSLFTYKEHLTLENFMPLIKIFDRPTPYGIVRKGIEKYTCPGELVLDPCCGIGITGLVTIETKRKAVLSDMNQLAVGIARNLFYFFDYTRVNRAWESIHAHTLEMSREELREWEGFLKNPLPPYLAFKRLLVGQTREIGQLYHSRDLDDLRQIYPGIRRIKDRASRELLQVVFACTLIESAQIILSKDGHSLQMPKTFERKYPWDICQDKLELLLAYKSLIRERRAWDLTWTPRVNLGSAYQLDYLTPMSIDYIILHLPEVDSSPRWEMSYLPEQLSRNYSNFTEEMIIELDYRGRQRVFKDLERLLNGLERVLKDDGYATLIFSGHSVLLALLIRASEAGSWQIAQCEVEQMRGGPGENYPIMSLTLQKKRQNTVVFGALNKMKVETLYNTEEEILRKIDHYLSSNKMARTEDIQKHLIENYLHDCLIDKPLEALLHENFLWTGKYWLKPSAEQKKALLVKRAEVIEREFHIFVREMVYLFMQGSESAVSYSELMNRFLTIKQRTFFHSPYYRLLVEQCELHSVKPDALIREYFIKRKKDQFETLPQVLRKILKGDDGFLEIIPGELVGLSEWSKDVLFRIYFEHYEKTRRQSNRALTDILGKKVLELLPEVQYLDERKKERIGEYVLKNSTKETAEYLARSDGA